MRLSREPKCTAFTGVLIATRQPRKSRMNVPEQCVVVQQAASIESSIWWYFRFRFVGDTSNGIQSPVKFSVLCPQRCVVSDSVHIRGECFFCMDSVRDGNRQESGAGYKCWTQERGCTGSLRFGRVQELDPGYYVSVIASPALADTESAQLRIFSWHCAQRCVGRDGTRSCLGQALTPRAFAHLQVSAKEGQGLTRAFRAIRALVWCWLLRCTTSSDST